MKQLLRDLAVYFGGILLLLAVYLVISRGCIYMVNDLLKRLC